MWKISFIIQIVSSGAGDNTNTDFEDNKENTNTIIITHTSYEESTN